MFVRKGDPAVMFFPRRVCFQTRTRIAALPKIFNEPVSLVIGRQLSEIGPFLLGSDVDDVLVDPFLIAAVVA
jgi:hypothetical protein